METRESTGKYWMFFFIFLIIIIVMLATPALRPWFWLDLPFVTTSFALAMRIM